MKYMISWFERPQGSPMEYENAQKRILEVFGQWKAPGNFKIDFFVIRVGEWGGHMLMECDDLVTIHKFCSMLPAFVFEVRPVVPVEDAVRGELEVIAYVTSGLLNKQIAAEMGVTEITVKVHRGNVMRKMGARSLADLVRMADALNLAPPKRT